MKQEIRIVIADDHPLMRQGLRQVIEIEPNLKIVGEAGNGSEALALIDEWNDRRIEAGRGDS
jgi:two-component system, NarL family, response regulator DegU